MTDLHSTVEAALEDEGVRHPAQAHWLRWVHRAIEIARAIGYTCGWADGLEANMFDAPAFMRVQLERQRQLQLKAEGRFEYTPSDDGLTNTQRLAMLTEELGEVARECLALDGLVQEVPNEHRLYKELTQVAAIAVAWLERAS